MKKTITIIAILTAGMITHLQAQAYTYVSPYFRSDGAVVSGHYRTVADGYSGNNWSYQGNVNPFTGRVGSSWR